MILVKKAWAYWQEFWFSPVPLLNLAIFRIVLTATMFGLYFARHFDLNLFFSDSGILPKENALQVLPEFYRPSVLLAFWPDSWLQMVHIVFLLGLLLLLLGVGNKYVRLLIGVTTVYLNEAFLQRNMSVMFGADQIGGIFLLYLILTNHNGFLSLRSWKEKIRPEFSSDLLTSVFYRMIQVQLCIVYMYTGFEKLKGASWWDGTALWSVFANPQFVITDMTWTRHFPLAIAILSFTTMLFEVYFPALVWVKKTRPIALVCGVFFHSGIAVLMALYAFGLVMISPYLLFLEPEAIKRVMNRLKMRIF